MALPTPEDLLKLAYGYQGEPVAPVAPKSTVQYGSEWGYAGEPFYFVGPASPYTGFFVIGTVMCNLSRSDFIAIAPGGAKYYDALSDAAHRFEIVTGTDQAHWLAQIAHESDGFTKVRENLNYSVDGLLKTFSRERITQAQCAQYGRSATQPANQPAIAEILYGGEWGRRNLGNTEPGDGWKFIGRGLKQLTGRANYRKCSLAVHRDERYLDSPEMLEQVEDAALSAGWFWQDKGLSAAVKAGGVKAVTMKVTGWGGGGDGAAVGLARRAEWFARFRGIVR